MLNTVSYTAATLSLGAWLSLSPRSRMSICARDGPVPENSRDGRERNRRDGCRSLGISARLGTGMEGKWGRVIVGARSAVLLEAVTEPIASPSVEMTSPF